MPEVEFYFLELGTFDLDGEDAGEIGGRFEPVGLDFELGGVADGFAGGGIGDGLEGERREFAAGHGDELERLSFNADEVLGVAVENPSGEFTGGGVAEEFEVVSVFADFDEGATVRSGVDVLMLRGVIMAGVVVFFAAGGEGAEDEGGEGGAN